MNRELLGGRGVLQSSMLLKNADVFVRAHPGGRVYVNFRSHESG